MLTESRSDNPLAKHTASSAFDPPIEYETIFPDRARAYLQTSGRNRPIIQSHVAFLTRQIMEEKWKVTCEAIKFDRDGRLIDGRHRLTACIKADRSIRVPVARGLSTDSFDAMDQGRRRTPGSILSMRGEKNSNMLAGAAAALWRENNKIPLYHCMEPRPSPQEIEETLDKNPDLREAVATVSCIKHISRPCVASCLWVLFSRKDRQMTDWFFAKIEDGTDLTRTDAVRHLRDQLIANQGSKAKMSNRDVATRIVRAWNAHRTGKLVRTLKGSIENLSFPDIK